VSNATIGEKDRFRMGTIIIFRVAGGQGGAADKQNILSARKALRADRMR